MKLLVKISCVLCSVCMVLAYLPLVQVRADDTWKKYTVGGQLDYASGIFAYDIDGNGKPDVVAAGSYANDVVWYKAPDNPTKSSWVKYTIDDNLGYAWGVFVYDINKDNKPDVVASGGTDNAVVWYQQPANPTKTWTKYVIDNTLTDARGVFVYDIDGDTHPDVVAAGYGAGAVFWYESPDDPTQSWTKHTVDTGLGGAWGIFVSDIDRDGHPDIVATGNNANAVIWYEAPDNPSQAWVKHVIDSGLTGAAGIFVCDVNNDQRPDIVASGSDANDIVWYKAPADPTKTWTKYIINTNLSRAVDISMCDINGDSRLDCVAVGRVADAVVWYECPVILTESWTKHVIDSSLDSPLQVRVCDIDKDGNVDIVVSAPRIDEVVWYRNLVIPYVQPPNQPTNQSPANGATYVGIKPTLKSSAYSGPEGRTHTASQWQITDKAGNYSNPVFYSNENSTNLTQINVPPETLDNTTTYYWRVRHKDDSGKWSDWSAETSFTTSPLVIRLVPSATSVVFGSTFTVAIQVEAGSQPVSAVDAYVKFDPVYLEATALSPDTTKLATVLGQRIHKTQGYVEYSAFKKVTPLPATGTFTVATVTFKCLKEADDMPISFAGEDFGKTDVFYEGQSVLGGAIGCTVDLAYDTPLKLQLVDSQTVVKKQKFVVALRVNAAQGQQVSAVDAFIDFNPAYLEAVQITPDTTALGSVSQKSFDNVSGRIDYRAVRNSSQSCPTGAFTVADITFQAKEIVSETALTLSRSENRKSAVVFDGGVVYGVHTDTAVKIVTGSVLMGHVALQGNSRPPWGFQVPLTIKLYNSSITLTLDNIATVEPAYVFSASNGDVTITEVNENNKLITFHSYAPVGTYHVALSSPQCLTKIVSGVIMTLGGATVNAGTLLCGNADGDNKVTEDDLNIFLNDYLRTPGDTDWNNGRCDFDRDDQVTCMDYSLLSANYTPPAS